MIAAGSCAPLDRDIGLELVVGDDELTSSAHFAAEVL